MKKSVKNLKIVSLSSGVIGEKFVRHEVEIGLRRLADYGITVSFSENAEKGIAYIQNHPESRAEDLLNAFRDADTDMIFCAIGGDDTYRLLPYLFENGELSKALSDKIFLGFSDSTFNHFMLHKLGLPTYYGQSFLSDICELDKNMLPYTEHYFSELIHTGKIAEIRPSDVWYSERSDFSLAAVGTGTEAHENEGFLLLQGNSAFSGEIFGGCLDSIFDMFDTARYADSAAVCEKYGLFPSIEEWRGKILLLETSEERATPEHYEKMLNALKKTGIFSVISGIICGKPIDECYFEEYKKIIVRIVDNPSLPIAANINVGHAMPRCIIPFGVKATVDTEEQVIRFQYE